MATAGSYKNEATAILEAVKIWRLHAASKLRIALIGTHRRSAGFGERASFVAPFKMITEP